MNLLQALNEGARDALIYEIILELKAELLKDEAKKNGKTQAKKAADNILKQMKNTGREGGAIIDENGKQIIGGVYSAVRLSEALPVEKLPERTQAPDYTRFINDAKKNEGEPLPLPSAAELSAYIKSEKAAHKGARGHKVAWDFGEGLPYVDAALLLDMLYLLPGTACIPAKKSVYSALYFVTESSDGLMMPMRRPAKCL